MKYTVLFLNKKGKVKSRVGCNKRVTAIYIKEMWLKDTEKKGVCIIQNNETKEEEIFKK